MASTSIPDERTSLLHFLAAQRQATPAIIAGVIAIFASSAGAGGCEPNADHAGYP